MQTGSTSSIIDYTTVPIDLLIEGRLWTGQATTFTVTCPKCGRIGVSSIHRDLHYIIVHIGRINGNMLEGLDYCTLESH